jgi:DNA primase
VIEKDEETGQDHTLADYLLHETNDLKIETPLFDEIYQLYRTEYLSGNNPTTQMFSSNPNPQIQDIAVGWMSPKHELSDKWKTFEIFIPKYEEMLNEFSYKMVLRIRKEKIQKEIEGLINEIDDSSEEDLEIIMNTIGKKRGIIKLIADELGSVI